MTEEQVRAIVREEWARMEADRAAQPTNYTGKTLELYQEALGKKLIDGSRPRSYATREEVDLMANAATKQ